MTKTSIVWKYFHSKTDYGKMYWYCKFCEFKYTHKNATKMFKHLQKCIKVPLEVKKLLRKQLTCNSDSESGASETTSTCSTTSTSNLTSFDSSTFLCSTSQKSANPNTLLSFLDQMGPAENQNITKHLAKAIYASGAPLSMVEHPLWKFFFRRLRPAFKLPNRKQLSTTLLEDEYNQCRSDVELLINKSKSLSVQCDGWSNVRNEGIFNFIISTPKPVFIEFVQTTDNKHTAEYIANEVCKIIERYNSKKFFAFVSDNAANMVKAGQIISEKYSHIIHLGCLAHTLNLLINDIRVCDSVSKLISEIIDYIKIIKNSQVLSATLKKIASSNANSNVSLHLPVKTRWSSILECLKSFLTCKENLQMLTVNQSVSGSLPNNMKRNLKDDEIFWVRVSKLKCLIEPIILSILNLESDVPNIHCVYSIFVKIEDVLQRLLPEAPVTTAEEKKIMIAFQARKLHAIKPVHYAAYLLNPTCQGSSLNNDQHIEAAEFIDQIAMNIEDVDDKKVMEDLANYKVRDGLFAKPFMWKAADRVSVLTWWINTGTELGKVATCILSIPPTSAATERTFSSFANIHTKTRNRLTTDRAGKLTFIAHNWRTVFNNSDSEDDKTLRPTVGLLQKVSDKEDSIELMEINNSLSEDDEFTSEDEIPLNLL